MKKPQKQVLPDKISRMQNYPHRHPRRWAHGPLRRQDLVTHLP